MHNVEDIIQSLIQEVENLNKEIAILKGLLEQEHKARLSIAEELESSQRAVKRLSFYLENT